MKEKRKKTTTKEQKKKQRQKGIKGTEAIVKGWELERKKT